MLWCTMQIWISWCIYIGKHPLKMSIVLWEQLHKIIEMDISISSNIQQHTLWLDWSIQWKKLQGRVTTPSIKETLQKHPEDTGANVAEFPIIQSYPNRCNSWLLGFLPLRSDFTTLEVQCNCTDPENREMMFFWLVDMPRGLASNPQQWFQLG